MKYLLCLLITSISVVYVSRAGSTDTTYSETWNINSLESIGGHGVTLYGNPKVVDTDKGKAVQFDGDGDMLLVDANPIGDAAEFTVEVVFKPDAGINITTQPRFIHIQDPNDADAKRITIEFRVNNQNEWYLDGFLKTDAANITLVDATKTHATSQWMHAAVIYKDKTFTTYVNGIKEVSGSVNYTQKVINSTGKTSIGARMNLVNWYSGLIKTLKVTHKALLPEEFIFIHENDTIKTGVLYIPDNKKNIDIYPVPADNKLYIKGVNRDMERPDFITIYNLVGKQELTAYLSPDVSNNVYVMDMQTLHDGIYLIKVQFENNYFTRKICIKH